jgi:2',3'-cyclic-nucleotide 2'-phosphodiesterase (5'-nucleotidase family)
MPMTHRHRARAARRLRGALLLVLGAALAAVWLGRAAPAAEPAAPAPGEIQFVNLILSAATKGEMLPCGVCKLKAGGLGRRATIIQASRDTADFVLAGDGGDLLLPAGPDPQVESFLVGMHAKLGYSVLGVGEEELKRGARYLDELVAPHPGLEWVSANILDAATRKPVFKPYVLRRAGKWVIGFTSVLEPEVWQKHAETQPGITVEPHLESLMRMMPRLRSECDLVVCFAHTRYLAVRDIAGMIEGMDIVVASHKPRVEYYPQRIGFAKQVFFGGTDGRFLSWSNVRFDAQGADPLNGRTFYLLDSVADDSTVVGEVLSFLGVREPPGDDGATADPEAETGGEEEPAPDEPAEDGSAGTPR